MRVMVVIPWGVVCWVYEETNREKEETLNNAYKFFVYESVKFTSFN